MPTTTQPGTSYDWRIVPPAKAEKWRILYEKYIEDGLNLAPDTWTIEDVRGMIATGAMVVHVCTSGDEVVAAIATELVPYSLGPCIRIVFMGSKKGHMDGWTPALRDHLDDVSRRAGVKRIEAIARPGLGRYLKDLGEVTHSVIVRKVP